MKNNNEITLIDVDYRDNKIDIFHSEILEYGKYNYTDSYVDIKLTNLDFEDKYHRINLPFKNIKVKNRNKWVCIECDNNYNLQKIVKDLTNDKVDDFNITEHTISPLKQN